MDRENEEKEPCSNRSYNIPKYIYGYLLESAPVR